MSTTTVNILVPQNGTFTLFAPVATNGNSILPQTIDLSTANFSTLITLPGAQSVTGSVIFNDNKTTFTLPAVINAAITPPFTTTPSASATPLSTNTTSPESNSSTAVSSSASSASTSIKLPAHLTPGAAAGIAIGCFAIGALIAFLAAFLFFRRPKRTIQKSPDHNGVVSYSQKPHPKQAGNASTINTSTVASGPALDQLLLAQVSDGDIKKDMTILTSQIEQHVDNYYRHSNPALDTQRITQALINLGYNEASSKVTPSALVALLVAPVSRQHALYHIISWTIFDRVSTSSSKVDLSLLPVSITRVLQAIPPSGPSSVDRDAYEIAFSKWRSTTAFLLHSQRNTCSRLTVDENTMQPTISANMSLLHAVLGPFVKSGSQTQQKTNLEAIFAQGGNFGLMLFSQPTKWDFVWENKRDSKQSIVVFPALVKTTDRNGRREVGGSSVRKVVVAEEFGRW